MFKIEKERFGDFIKIKLVNSDSGEYVSIIPEFGGNVNEIVLKKNGNLFSVLDGDKSFGELVKNEWFRGAKLVPFPNRVNDGEYVHGGVRYNLPLNFPSQKHAIHGLVFDKCFKIRKNMTSKSKAVLIVEYFGSKLRGYPFDFLVSIKYMLSSDGFECRTTIVNNSKIRIPVGDGWHPYFKLGDEVDSLFLRIPSSKKISVNRRMIPTGKKVMMDKFAKGSKVGKGKLDTGFVVSKRGIATTEIVNDKLGVRIEVWQEAGKGKYGYLQVFVHPSRKSIAIEPMTCNIDAFNNKGGLMLLSPGGKFFASYGVRLK